MRRIDHDTVIAVNRFGLGARPGDLERIHGDAREWLAGQTTAPAALTDEYLRLPPSARIVTDMRTRFDERRRAGSSAGKSTGNAEAMRALRAELSARARETYAQQVTARIRAAVATPAPFQERLAHFWANHFATSADKATTRALAATLEAEAVRPHVNGRFVDMLVAAEQHPAMLAYLDNFLSVGPDSDLARRARRKGRREPGINENLAREILELHTLGVDGGYSQDDVAAFAHVLTGWTVGGLRKHDAVSPGTFVFEARMHEPGAWTVLGTRYPDTGHEQGLAVLRDVARHPATARHIATKLVRHFVADRPPAEAVERVAAAFRDSEGDLPVVYRALVACPEAWEPARRKVKSPEEFVVSTYRALDFDPTGQRHTIAPLRLLGQMPYAPGSPAGWPDTAGDWVGSDALLKRIEWATAVGERAGNRMDAVRLAGQILGPTMGQRTRLALARASSPAQALTLLLASPEFQRR